MTRTASVFFVALMRRVGEEYLDAVDSGTTLIPSPVPPPSPKALVRRASFHEAGHGIMNWHTPAAAFIRSMRLSDDCDDTGVITAWNTHLPRHMLLWDLLTCFLAGVAAEDLWYGWHVPESALNDLVAARVCGQHLARMQASSPRHPSPQLPPRQMRIDPSVAFQQPLSTTERQLFVHAYQRAFATVYAERWRVYRVAKVLYGQRYLRREVIEALMGPRPDHARTQT